jgi:fibronectin type 3 domain-containing protein
LSTVLAISLFTGCGSKTPAPAEQLETDPNLPVVNVTNHITDMTSATFEWKPVKDHTVKGYYVYRAKENAEDGKLTRINTIKTRFPTHFTDTKLDPGTAYSYSFTAFSDPMVQSQPSSTVKVLTKPLLSSVSFFEKIGNLPRRAKLIWRPHTSMDVKGYRIERRDGDSTEWKEIERMDGRLHAEYIDAELKDNAVYHYRILAVTFEDIVSHPSDQVKVITKPLPVTIKALQATTNLPRRIDVSWASATVPDFDHYRVYRATNKDGSYSYHVKTRQTSHTDQNISKDGQVYFYKVTAVDKDKLESPRQEVPAMGSTLVKPATPLMITGTFSNNTYKLTWKKGDDRAVSYIVLKKTHKSWVSSEIEEIKDIKETTFVDINVASDISYEYQVVAVDKNGLWSEPSKAKPFSFRAE